MCNQLLLSVLETVRTAESRSHDLTANPVALTQLGFNDAYQFHILCGHLLFRRIFLVTVAGDNSEKADMVIIKLGSLAHYLEQIDNKRQQLQ